MFAMQDGALPMKSIASSRPSLSRSGGTWNWLGSVSDAAFNDLNDACRCLHLARGDIVYRRGEVVGAIYQVVSGRVRFSAFSASGKEIRYVHLEQSDCFGELGILDGRPAHHDAEVDGGTVLMCLPATDFHRLRNKYPDINEALVLFLARRVRSVYETIDDAYSRDVPHRLARRLWSLYRTRQRAGHDTNIPVSHEDLAKMIGSSR